MSAASRTLIAVIAIPIILAFAIFVRVALWEAGVPKWMLY